MLPLRSIPGITAWPLRSVSISVTDGPAPDLSPAAANRWSQMCLANPKHFDGPLLSVTSFDPDRAHITCRRDRYARLAVQPDVPTGVQQLSVTGILTSLDAGGRKHCLLGRRGPHTRIFGGMWELGPSGGIPPPTQGTATLDSAVLRQLADEAREEVGLPIATGTIVAYIRDQLAHSDDIVIECPLGPLESLPPHGPANWEYSETRWVPIDSIEQFDSSNAAAIIAATRAIFRVLNWIDVT